MYKRILVPLDGSEVAASVLPYIANLAKQLAASVTLFMVIAPSRTAPEMAYDAVREEAEALVQRRAQELQSSGVETATEVVTGEPAQEIIDYAKEEKFDLIAIGTRGHSGIRRGILGSVTDEVVRSSPIPVLVLSPGAVQTATSNEFKLSTVTVPLDGSDRAENALPYAQRLAEQLSLELRLLRVVSISSVALTAVDGGVVDTTSMEEDLEAEASGYLSELADSLAAKGLQVAWAVHKGSPGLAIVDSLKSVTDTMVAICTHGRSGLRRLVIGSVADSVIRSAEVPVLVLTPPGDGSEDPSA